MKKLWFQKSSIALISSLCVLCFSSCFTTKTSQYNQKVSGAIITLNSEPKGATVLHDGQTIGVTPCQFELKEYYQVINLKDDKSVNSVLAGAMDQVNSMLYNKNEADPVELLKEALSYKFTFIKDGYEIKNAIYSPNITKAENFAASFAGVDYPATFSTVLKKKAGNSSAYEKDPTIVKGEANNMVSRDNPGGTALERTIIRWYFDSEPRGARVFWRVVSSIPSIVKNTNELYLGTTPYEDTRSFNILGLTYENSRDVQIEIKLTRPGYMDQIKRFNVRQAIDQQEISSYFDLVKKGE